MVQVISVLHGLMFVSLSMTHQILHRLPHTLTDLLAPDKDRRLWILDHLGFTGGEGAFYTGVFGFTNGAFIRWSTFD